MNDARWKAQRPSGRLALLVAADDYVTDDLSFTVSHREWGERAGGIAERTMDDVAADATGCGLLSRSRQRKPDGMLGTYSYRFDADLLPAHLAGGTRRRFGGSSCGADLAGQRRKKEKNALTESTNGGTTSTAHGSSKLETLEGEATSRASANGSGSVKREADCPGCLRMTGSRLIGGARVCGDCGDARWGS
jgi:hypothetical protein